MSDVAIRVEQLAKQYTIGTLQRRPNTLRDHLVGTIQRLLQKVRRQVSLPETIWALKDVSFEVKQGEVLGIIGCNGAGKSTLLKILSRITEPTRGRAEIYGRVASLLEVGTGFHPELTGRENVYLNGAVLGMSRAEITRKFDEIVAFSGVEKFIDTPVKYYSSGMKVRLAFSVAAHLEPEILIIDEVLAVGDAAFQQKCLGRMQHVAHEGRTVLFVSHNMGAISNLCDGALWIDGGCLRKKGSVNEIINNYLAHNSMFKGRIDLQTFAKRKGDSLARFHWAAVKNASGNITNQFMMGDDIIMEIGIYSEKILNKVSLSLDWKTITGIPVLHIVDRDSGFTLTNIQGEKNIKVCIPNIPLYPGSYLISLWIGDLMGNDFDYIEECIQIDINESNIVERSGLSWKHAIFSHKVFWNEIL
jgi:lipopolysaccharide transport system ATP-binding protein